MCTLYDQHKHFIFFKSDEKRRKPPLKMNMVKNSANLSQQNSAHINLTQISQTGLHVQSTPIASIALGTPLICLLKLSIMVLIYHSEMVARNLNHLNSFKSYGWFLRGHQEKKSCVALEMRYFKIPNSLLLWFFSQYFYERKYIFVLFN